MSENNVTPWQRRYKEPINGKLEWSGWMDCTPRRAAEQSFYGLPVRLKPSDAGMGVCFSDGESTCFGPLNLSLPIKKLSDETPAFRRRFMQNVASKRDA
jgi:hypothetical protein